MQKYAFVKRRASCAAKAMVRRTASIALVLLALSPVVVLATSGAKADDKVRVIDLSEIGFSSGAILQRREIAKTFYFPLTTQDIVSEAVLNVYYEAVLPNYEPAAILLKVNGNEKHLQLFDRPNNKIHTQIKLTKEDLNLGYVRFDFEYQGPTLDNRCDTTRPTAGFVTLLAKTNLEMKYNPNIVGTMRSAWELLPRHVTISLGEFGEEQGAQQHEAIWGAWYTAMSLRRKGHEVSFNRLPSQAELFDESSFLVIPPEPRVTPEPISLPTPPTSSPIIVPEQANPLGGEEDGAKAQQSTPIVVEGAATATPAASKVDAAEEVSPLSPKSGGILVGDIIVASVDEVERLSYAVRQHKQLSRVGMRLVSSGTLSEGETDADRAQIWRMGRRTIVSLPPNQAKVSRVINDMRLGDKARSGVAFTPNLEDGVTLADLGIDDQELSIVDKGEWTIYFDLTDLPAGTTPKAFGVDLISAPSETGRANLLYAYYNNVLVSTHQIDNTKDMQRITMPLPRHLTRLQNSIRLILHRQEGVDPCDLNAPNYPALLSKSSMMITEPLDGPPKNFFDLPPLLSTGAAVYLPTEVMERPVASLQLLTEVGVQLLADVPPPDVIFYDTQAGVTPRSSFIVMGPHDLAGIEGPVMLDREGVGVTGPNGEMLLNLEESKDISVFQLARANNKHGLWISTEGSDLVPTVGPISLDRGDVAFVDSQGAVLNLHTGEDEIVEITYSTRSEWQDVLQQNKFLVFVGIWILLTLGVGVMVRSSIRRRLELRKNTPEK